MEDGLFERFEALPFDAETSEEGDWPAEWMFVPLVGLFGVIGFRIVRGDWAPLGAEVWFMLGLAGVWMLIYRQVKRHEQDDLSRYLGIGVDGIRVHVPGWYETFVPYGRITRIVEEPAYRLSDMLGETFSWYGRVPERGRHVAIYCNGRVAAHSSGLFGRFWRRNFRAKLVDPQRFVIRANARLDAWRREHGRAAA